MADISVTASAVQAAATALLGNGTAGGTITAGQPVYKDATDSNKLKAAVNSSVAASAVVGIALNGASDEQPVDYIRAGDLTFNSVLTVGEIYVLSANAGGIAPEADNGSGEYVTTLGIGKTATVMKVSINASGVAVP